VRRYPDLAYDHRSLIQRLQRGVAYDQQLPPPGISNYTTVPYAPCRCVRALLRTPLADLGLRSAMIAIF
jgi:hypothetical protein